MLSLLEVQISAAVALVATAAGVIGGLAQRRRGSRPAPVLASRPPARGTEAVWILGTFVAVFWPVGVFVAPSLAYFWPPFPDFPYAWIVQIAGIALGIGGGALFARSSRALGVHLTPAIQVQAGHRLVETGPYRTVRHPLYTAIMLIAAGQTLLFLSLPMGVLTLILVGLATYRARLEEGLLRSPAAFGARYDAYMARTGRFLPASSHRP